MLSAVSFAAQALLFVGAAQARATRSTITVTATAYDCLCTPSPSTLATGRATASPSAAAGPPNNAVVVVAAAPGTTSSTRATIATSSTTTVRAATPVTGAITTAGGAATSPNSNTGSTSGSNGLTACPNNAHKDYNGSKNWPRLITTVNSNTPAVSHGTDYFAYVGAGNSTLLTYDFNGATTCTLQYQFPTKQQILALQGTTDYTFSGDGAVTLYKLATVADAVQSYNSKPARTATSYDFVLQPGTNTTIVTFPCGAAGTSATYELVARGNTVLKAFFDWNPPPHGLILLTC